MTLHEILDVLYRHGEHEAYAALKAFVSTTDKMTEIIEDVVNDRAYVRAAEQYGPNHVGFEELQEQIAEQIYLELGL